LPKSPQAPLLLFIPEMLRFFLQISPFFYLSRASLDPLSSSCFPLCFSLFKSPSAFGDFRSGFSSAVSIYYLRHLAIETFFLVSPSTCAHRGSQPAECFDFFLAPPSSWPSADLIWFFLCSLSTSIVLLFFGSITIGKNL